MSRRGLDRDSRSRRRQRVSLDSRENLDSVKKLVSTIEISRSRSRSRFRLDNNVQTKKSRSRSRNSSRSEIFGVSRQFVSISTEKCVDFCIFSSRFLNPSRLFIIFRLKRPRQCQDFLTNLDSVSTNLDCISTNLENLNASRQTRCASTISTKISIKKKLIST